MGEIILPILWLNLLFGHKPQVATGGEGKILPMLLVMEFQMALVKMLKLFL